LVVRQAVPEGDDLVHKEVEYWLNTNGSLSGAGRYDIDTNANKYESFTLTLNGEVMELYGTDDKSATHFITGFDATQPKRSYFRPVHRRIGVFIQFYMLEGMDHRRLIQ
jgi:hypothetical protein